MARCKHCGREVYGMNLCYSCSNKWAKVKAGFFDEAVEKYGKLSGATLKPIQTHVKRKMREWEKAGRPTPGGTP